MTGGTGIFLSEIKAIIQYCLESCLSEEIITDSYTIEEFTQKVIPTLIPIGYEGSLFDFYSLHHEITNEEVRTPSYYVSYLKSSPLVDFCQSLEDYFTTKATTPSATTAMTTGPSGGVPSDPCLYIDFLCEARVDGQYWTHLSLLKEISTILFALPMHTLKKIDLSPLSVYELMTGCKETNTTISTTASSSATSPKLEIVIATSSLQKTIELMKKPANYNFLQTIIHSLHFELPVNAFELDLLNKMKANQISFTQLRNYLKMKIADWAIEWTANSFYSEPDGLGKVLLLHNIVELLILTKQYDQAKQFLMICKNTYNSCRAEMLEQICTHEILELESKNESSIPTDKSIPCDHPYLELWDANEFHCCQCKELIHDPDRLLYEQTQIKKLEEDEKTHPPSDSIDRGVTIGWLKSFTESHRLWDLPTWKVRLEIVLRQTNALRCRYVELPEMQSFVGKADTFICHCWAAKFGDLVTAVCDGDANPNRKVWIDIFAVRQWPSLAPDFDFSETVAKSTSFILVSSSLQSLANITNHLPQAIKPKIPFFRVWCLAEIYSAITNQIRFIMKIGSCKWNSMTNQYIFSNDIKMNTLVTLSRLIDINQAEATNSRDKEMIFHKLETKQQGFDVYLNKSVRGVISGAMGMTFSPKFYSYACNDRHLEEEVLNDPKFLCAVAGCGYLDLVEKYLTNHGSIDSTAVLLAASGGHLTCLELMLSHGLTVNTFRDKGLTAIFATIINHHIDCLEFLMKLGCDYWSKGTNDSYPICVAITAGRLDCATLLLNYRKGGIDLNLRNSVGVTLLILAIEKDAMDFVKLLISEGADVNGLTSEGISPLAVAVGKNDLELVKALLRAGANKAHRLRSGLTAKELAQQKKFLAIVELLNE